MRYDPAAEIIERLGGLTNLARATGVTPTSVQRWRMAVEKGGTGGFIPRKHHEPIIRFAAERGYTLPVHAFVDVAAARAALPREGEAA